MTTGRTAAQDWFASSTTSHEQWTDERVLALKHAGGHRVSVVIPARDEEATIADVVSVLRRSLVDGRGLVDELVVMDSDSSDGTGPRAADAGARVHRTADVRPELGSHPGKGEALWKSQLVTTGDVLVFVDADLTQFGPHFVRGLVGALLERPERLLVKGFYDRVMDQGAVSTTEGGRVTELVARPLLDLWWPDLAYVVQPLAGEWAVRRSFFESVPVPTAYGVELSTLLDAYERHGLAAIAQVDLGSRTPRHQAVHDLGLMAAELLAVAQSRLGGRAPAAGPELVQFGRAPGGDVAPRVRGVPVEERPPAAAVGVRQEGAGER